VRRWLLIGAGLAVLVVGGLAAAYVLVKQRQARDVHGSPTVEFVTTEAPVVAKPKEPGVLWEAYGFDEERLRVSPYARRPPFRKVWTFRAQALVEFPPVVAFGRLYFAANDGDVFAISAKTGKRAWKRATGRCQAASPAVAGRLVFVPFMNRHPCNRKQTKGLTGELVAYYAGSGEVRWTKRIGPTESSPVVDRGYVYTADWNGRVWSFVGSTDGKVYSFGATSGAVRWSHGTGGYVYSSPAVWRQRVYVGSYSGRFYCLDAATGDVKWSFRANGPISGSPTVMGGVVYFSTLKRRTYGLDARTGRQVWSWTDGKYSPVVADDKRMYLVGYARVYGMVEK
jgi:outer membrane protein assembly factor BamB